MVSSLGEIWRWDGYVSKGKQNSSTKAILEQLKNRRLKQLSAEEKKWQDIFTKAQQRIDELKERESNLTDALSNLRSVPNNITLEKIRLQKLIDENKSTYDKIANKLRKTEQNATEINKKLKLQEIKLNEFVKKKFE